MNKQKHILIVGIIIVAVIILWTFLYQNRPIEYPNETISALEAERLEKPNDKEVLLKLALEYHSLNLFGPEEVLYKELIKINPTEPLYRFNLGTTLLDQRRYEESSDYFEEGITLNHKLMFFYFPLLDLYEDPKTRSFVDIDLILNNLKRIEDESPALGGISNQGLSEIYTYYGRIYRIQGKYEDALAVYKKMKKDNLGDSYYVNEQIDSLESLIK